MQITRLLPALSLFLTPAFLQPVSSSPAVEYPILHISNFLAFHSSNSSLLKSHLVFDVLDPRPGYLFLNITCTFVPSAYSPDAPDTIYTDGWKDCNEGERGSELWFWHDKKWLVFRRLWQQDEGDKKSLVTGRTDNQYTYWSAPGERLAGCANVTMTGAGTYYSRTTDWEFPIHTIIA